ncbi:MAG: hypothetical protein F6K11_23100 [Leptolyngbya sp. SIO3F4]|nr:hypothetical protein [Leptolyngbya sp. SIO3F4]
MSIIHGIVGEKGGVGKSIFALTLGDYLEAKGNNFVICDADRSNGDVGNAYDGKRELVRSYFTEDTDEVYRADELLEIAVSGSDILLNTPAQAHRAMCKWLSLGSASLALEAGVEFYFWFVTSGSQDSINLFFESLKAFEGMPHCLVRNENKMKKEAIVYDYSDPESWPPVKDAIETYGAQVITLPDLDGFSIDVIKNHHLTFPEARVSTEHLGFCPRSRFITSLRGIHSVLDSLEVFSCGDIIERDNGGGSEPKKV